mmetsp:Transcript_7039/g.8897  ORF Transcript_7039/g.8897 Transcript_7039/m.8897 type:complete len:205 (-) Transcript_7039:309-923(-)|eukprot:CAMPEP_0204831302 /NCGR_PEP_ID=MMETSP1346-20131115/10346_1 /ASSEMBLY_ACC=CAM_ASM_000771 /TAXON_ID=215587 /ORGANISM="Aplanochytrium stocchinoi, Strain GSBS06" /LENGTH=204 /DNA_ID=CAMNT_0051962235 /DNA_START=195 /DNA_END=809 /DNA_ORIENTATION=+
MKSGIVAAAVVVTGAAAAGLAFYLYREQKKQQFAVKQRAVTKKKVQFAEQQPEPKSGISEANRSELKIDTKTNSLDEASVVVDLLEKLLESARIGDSHLAEQIKILDSQDDLLTQFNQPKAVSFILQAMEPLNKIREEVKANYNVGEEELKKAISNYEDDERISELTHELAEVKASIADKSRQLIIKSQVQKGPGNTPKQAQVA